MSDRGYAILVTAAKYILINILTFIFIIMLTRHGWIHSEDTMVILHAIINAAAVILGKQQKILDRLNELSPDKKEEEN